MGCLHKNSSILLCELEHFIFKSSEKYYRLKKIIIILFLIISSLHVYHNCSTFLNIRLSSKHGVKRCFQRSYEVHEYFLYRLSVAKLINTDDHYTVSHSIPLALPY